MMTARTVWLSIVSVCAVLIALLVVASAVWAANIEGTEGDDPCVSLTGTDNIDWINAHGGDDCARGLGASDTLLMGDGRDSGYGNAGADDVYGGHGSDVVDGGGGNDNVYAGCQGGCSQTGDGIDYLYGGEGNDVLGADNGKQDFVNGEGGFDYCYVDSRDIVLTDCEVVR